MSAAYKHQGPRCLFVYVVAKAEAAGGEWDREQALADMVLQYDGSTHPTQPIPLLSLEECAARWGWVTKPTKGKDGNLRAGGNPAVKRVRRLWAAEEWKPNTAEKGTRRAGKGHEKGTNPTDEREESEEKGHGKGTERARKGPRARVPKPTSNLQPPVLRHMLGFLKSPPEGKSAPVDPWEASLALWEHVKPRSAKTIRKGGKTKGLGGLLASAIRTQGAVTIVQRLRWVAFCDEHPDYDPDGRCGFLRERGSLKTLINGGSRAEYDLWAALWYEDGCPHIDGAPATPAAHGGEGAAARWNGREVRAEDYDLEPEELEGMGFRVIVGGVE